MQASTVAGRLRWLCAIAMAIAGATAPAANGQGPTGATYYVSASGSDANSGLAPEFAWRTVDRVNDATLAPGDRVLFEAGSTFSDTTLMPDESGAAAHPITFGSYGFGRATLGAGVWLSDVDWLTFENLALSGVEQGILASARADVDQIVIRHMAIRDVGVAINSANASNDSWTIADNEIERTRDSGLILEGHGFTVARNTIVDTGLDASIGYGKHGIYLDAADTRVVANTIRGFSANGVSARRRNSTIEYNRIEDGPIGIAWFQEDPLPGTSTWRRNTIRGTTSAGIYVSPVDSAGPTRESFVIAGNVLAKAAGRSMDLSETRGTYAVRRTSSAQRRARRARAHRRRARAQRRRASRTVRRGRRAPARRHAGRRPIVLWTGAGNRR